VSRSDRDRLLDILEAGAAIAEHLQRGPLSDGLVFDAVRVRLIEIGEAVKDIPVELLSQQPTIPWRQVAAMRDQLAHRYFDTSHAIVAHTVGPASSSCWPPPGHCWQRWTPRADLVCAAFRGPTGTGRRPGRGAAGAQGKIHKGLPFGLLRGQNGFPCEGATGASLEAFCSPGRGLAARRRARGRGHWAAERDLRPFTGASDRSCR